MIYNFKPIKPPSEEQSKLMQRMLAETSNSRYKSVSFKMDGILVLTPFSDRADLFQLMEEYYIEICGGKKKSFAELRIAAEDAALKKHEIAARVNIEIIYKILAKTNDISSDNAKKLMEYECELMEHFSFSRECGKALFRDAKNNKKRVIIISESFYPKKVVANILEKCGYGSYDGLIMVNEIANATGESWFAKTVEKAGVKAEQLLHIGGDVAFDIELPIVKGSKALLLAPIIPQLLKSGRLRGYLESEKLLEYDSPQYLSLRCVLGLYAAYSFDIPQGKAVFSDFCDNEYMMGFIVLGSQSLYGDEKIESELQKAILTALKKNPRILDGFKDFSAMFEIYFGKTLEKYGFEGCQLPIEFVEKSCSSADRKHIQPYLSSKTFEKWANSVKEPEIVSFYSDKTKKGALSRLADRMFPKNTFVRTIVDKMLYKIHK